MKKMLVCFAALMLFLSISLGEESKAGKYICGDFEYILLPDGTTEISRYMGTAAELSVPSQLDDHAVTAIGARAFLGNRTLRGVTIPQGVTKIGESAFGGCRELESVMLPESLRDIGASAFASCQKLREISLPEGVVSIGEYAFSWCSSLTKINIPDHAAVIGANPFQNSGLLAEIKISADHPVFALVDGVLYDQAEKRLICYPCALPAESYEILPGTLSIGDAAFYASKALKQAILPEGVESIGRQAFSLCSSLTEMEIPEGVVFIGDEGFGSCSSLTSVILPRSITTLEEYAFAYNTKKLVITVPRDSYAAAWCEAQKLQYIYQEVGQ